jgi:hypothetical protein
MVLPSAVDTTEEVMKNELGHNVVVLHLTTSQRQSDGIIGVDSPTVEVQIDGAGVCIKVVIPINEAKAFVARLNNAIEVSEGKSSISESKEQVAGEIAEPTPPLTGADLLYQQHRMIAEGAALKVKNAAKEEE